MLLDFETATGTLDIIVTVAGRDLIDRIDKEMSRLGDMVDTVMIYLNMQDPKGNPAVRENIKAAPGYAEMIDDLYDIF